MGGVLTVPETFCWNWGQLIQFNTEYLCDPGEYIHYARATVSYHSFARNSICKQVEGDWVLMLDVDHTFEPDIALRLLMRMEKYKVDVLTGLYQYKVAPHAPVIYQANDRGEFEPIGDWDDTAEIFQVGSAGAGCLMIRRGVLNLMFENDEEPFDEEPPFSEDHSFFRRLKKLGIPAFCCPGIEAPHLRIEPITMEDFNREGLEVSNRIEVQGYA